MESPRTALVTGASGFVGNTLCELLVADGWSVRAVVRPTSQRGFLRQLGCELVTAPLARDGEAELAKALAPCAAVFHLAGVTKALDQRAFDAVNVEGARALAAAARRAGFAGSFVLVSSLAAAGPAPRGGVRPNDAPARPVSAYGASKRRGEKAVLAVRLPGPICILRPGAIYGPREHEIHQVIKPAQQTGLALHTGPDLRVQMTHVEDVARACIVAARLGAKAAGTWQVNDQAAYRVSEMMAIIGEALGRRLRFIRLPAAAGWGIATVIDLASRLTGKPLSPFNLDKMREITSGDWVADSMPFRHATGWKPRWKLRDGMDQTIRWYRANGWL